MNREDKKEVRLLKDGIESVLRRVFHTAPTMTYSDSCDIARMSYTLGVLVGKEEKQKEIELFRRYDRDEKARKSRKGMGKPEETDLRDSGNESEAFS